MDKRFDENIALLVPSCDAFCDIAIQFFKYKDMFMPWWENNTYYVVEEVKCSIDHITTIHTGKDVNWTFRMKRALEQIKEEYFLFLLDDYYIGTPVSEDLIAEAYYIVKKENLRYYRFNNRPMVRGLTKQFKDYKFLLSIPNNIRYGIVLGEGIYRRDFLEEMLGDEDKSIWRVETDRLADVEKNDGTDIPGCVVDTRNILNTYNGVLKGQWIPSTIRHFKNIGYPISRGDRQVQSIGSQIYRSLCGLCDKYLSPRQIRFVKQIASFFGVKFVTKQ